MITVDLPLGSDMLCFHSDDRHIVSPAGVLTVEHAGDEARMSEREPRVGVEVPAGQEPIGVHH